ncbi:MAG: hypothetical protein PHQ23_16985 [Candidatus Wallbacteria bacterium]|nr:hypothetical protein [Candidatus Wallbacteria bacterium]
MILCRPLKTLPVSMTGTQCELQCGLCHGHYLESMKPWNNGYPVLNGCSSVLLSGGFRRDGSLVLPNPERIAAIAESGVKINIHLGFYRPFEQDILLKLCPHISTVSFNFMPDSGALSVIAPHFSPDSYLDSYAHYLDLGLNIAPHVLLGLAEPANELLIAEKLKPFSPKKVVLLVLIPGKGQKPRPAGDVIDSVRAFRKTLPAAQLIMGCMRPGGAWRDEFDSLLEETGVNMVVNPHPLTVSTMTVTSETDQCCAL